MARSRAVVRFLLPRLACLGVAVAITQVFFIQYCDLLFDCGCRALWAGAAEYCNIHQASPPHCPWCLHDGSFGQWAFGLVSFTQAVIAIWPGRLGMLRAVSVLLAFPVVGAVAGLAMGIATGYWN